MRGEGADTRLVVDIVVHGDGEDHDETGPGCAWASRAAVGDRLVLLGPRRGQVYGGIEFDPGAATRLLLVGDETAVPAICATLEHLPDDAAGAAFLEVPIAADVQSVQHPAGVTVVWLARDGAPHGSLLQAAVLDHLGRGRTRDVEPRRGRPGPVGDPDVLLLGRGGRGRRRRCRRRPR